MGKSLTLNAIVQQILINKSHSSLTARDLAEQVYIQYPEYCQKKMQKNNRTADKKSVCSQLAAEINARVISLEKYNIFSTTDRPRKFYYDRVENTQIPNSVKTPKKREEKEKPLYAKLAQYCKNILDISALRIDEKTSSKEEKNKNKWLHADMVGYQDLTTNFNEITKECLKEYAAQRSLLYSFEVKDGEINIGNIRESFFQTVSNSSWANYSYLVAEKIKDERTKQELLLLCESFKIGFIKLNKDIPENSEIIIQAPRKELDWNMMNRIATENADFQKFLRKITSTYRTDDDYARKLLWE